MDKHALVDRLFLVGGIIAAISLIPTILTPTAYIPRASSAPTAVAMLLFLTGQYMLRLKWATWFSLITVACWIYIVLFRGTP